MVRGAPSSAPSGAPPLPPLPASALQTLLVLDVEATCDQPQRAPHEIIEWPVVAVDAATAMPIAEFHRYVRPTEVPQLSPFCQKLTGIAQADVDAASTLDVVLAEFDEWIADLGLVDRATGTHLQRWALATDGPWDLNSFLARECARKGIDERAHLRQYVNIRKAFVRSHKLRTLRGCSLDAQLSRIGLKFEGRPHSGRDDARNIARVLCWMLRRRSVHCLSINEAADPAVPGRYIALSYGVGGGVGGTLVVRGPKKARGKKAKAERAADEAARERALGEAPPTAAVPGPDSGGLVVTAEPAVAGAA